METETSSDTGTTFDLDAATDKIGASLFPDSLDETPENEPSHDEVAAPAASTPAPTAPAAPVTPTARSVPKAWPKEMHDYWGKTDPKVQEYLELREKQMVEGLETYKTDAQFAKQFKDSLTPYQQTLQQLNLDPVTAAKHLFQADHVLRYSPPDQKAAYLRQLAQTYGIDLGQVTGGATTQQAPIDPVIQSMQQKLQAIESGLTAQQQSAYKQLEEETSKQVESFASDPTHPHFEDVADDIVRLLKTGLSLQESYEKSVWANPLTREKELQARLLTETEKQKENARLQALPKAKAAHNNVRSLDSRRAPTEPVGTMADTMRETLKEIRNRGTSIG